MPNLSRHQDGAGQESTNLNGRERESAKKDTRERATSLQAKIFLFLGILFDGLKAEIGEWIPAPRAWKNL